MADTIFVRGEGGAVFQMDLPLSEPIQQRFNAGHIVRVNPDGSPWEEPASDAPAKAPAKPRRASAAKPTTESEEG